MEDGEIQELLIERPSGKGIVGNIYKGRVTRVLPGMQAAFVDIGLEKAAFLYVDDIFVHSEIWEEEEGTRAASPLQEIAGAPDASPPEASAPEAEFSVIKPVETSAQEPDGNMTQVQAEEEAAVHALESEADEDPLEGDEEEEDEEDEDDDDELDFDDVHTDEDDDDDQGPVEMGSDPEDPNDQPPGTVAPKEAANEPSSEAPREAAGNRMESDPSKRKHRRGRRGGRFRRKEPRGPNEGGEKSSVSGSGGASGGSDESYPENYREQVSDEGHVRIGSPPHSAVEQGAEAITNRPQIIADGSPVQSAASTDNRQEFRSQRGRDRRIRARTSMRPPRPTVSIQDLLKEGQEVLVQVAKDPIATKGARLTCHISLPGRHLVCMPTIDHVGVSRRIERDEERTKTSRIRRKISAQRFGLHRAHGLRKK